MKRLMAGILTVAIMGLLVYPAVRSPQPRPRTEPGTGMIPGPAEAALRDLLADARRGDVSSYLSAFDGPVRDRLEREVQERGRDAFAADLRRASESRKSHAVFAPEPDGPDAVRIVVETVYDDRNERQTYRLAQGPEGWRVVDVETVRGHTPKARFGTPAQFVEPEGVPVQGIDTGPSDDPAASNP